MGIALFFGSTTGNTEDIADQIRNILGSDRVDIFNVADDSVSLMLEYSTVICGIPTWDYGELQADWEDIWEEIDALDLTGIQMAFFGCGDQIGYPEWYQDAMGLLHDKCIGHIVGIAGGSRKVLCQSAEAPDQFVHPHPPRLLLKRGDAGRLLLFSRAPFIT